MEFLLHALRIISCFVLFVSDKTVFSYKNGLTSVACSNMHPYHWYFNESHVLRVDEGKHHLSDTVKSPAPFVIRVNSTEYDHKKSTPIEVTIEGSTFRGFYMMAIQSHKSIDDPGTYPLGTFVSTSGNEKTILCNLLYGGVSHTNNKDKNSVTVLWLPPIQNMGSIHFVATVAKDFYSFWTNVKSQSISVKTHKIPYYLQYLFHQGGQEWYNAPNWLQLMRWVGMYEND